MCPSSTGRHRSMIWPLDSKTRPNRLHDNSYTSKYSMSNYIFNFFCSPAVGLAFLLIARPFPFGLCFLYFLYILTSIIFVQGLTAAINNDGERPEMENAQHQRSEHRTLHRDRQGWFPTCSTEKTFRPNSTLIQIEAKVFELKECQNPKGDSLQITERRSQLARTIFLPQLALPWLSQTLDDTVSLQVIANPKWVSLQTGFSCKPSLV